MLDIWAILSAIKAKILLFKGMLLAAVAPHIGVVFANVLFYALAVIVAGLLIAAVVKGASLLVNFMFPSKKLEPGRGDALDVHDNKVLAENMFRKHNEFKDVVGKSLSITIGDGVITKAEYSSEPGAFDDLKFMVQHSECTVGIQNADVLNNTYLQNFDGKNLKIEINYDQYMHTISIEERLKDADRKDTVKLTKDNISEFSKKLFSAIQIGNKSVKLDEQTIEGLLQPLREGKELKGSARVGASQNDASDVNGTGQERNTSKPCHHKVSVEK